jgi:hypothetical protein
MIDIDKYEGHTEGPWSIKIGLVNGYSVKDANGDHVCTIPDLTGMSNKHIIADAPDLLAEVKQLRKIIEDVHLALTVDDWYCDRPVDARITNALGILSEVIE